MSQMDTVEFGQYWLCAGASGASLWLIDAIEPDDREEGLWVSMVLVYYARRSQRSWFEIEDTYSVPIEEFDNPRWSQVDEEDVPLYILGEVG